MSNTEIRPYEESDKLEVMGLLRQHIPAYFAASEEADFQSYLEKEREDYFVVANDDAIIACGGINYFPLKHQARISWDMVHPMFQGKGIGGQLLRFRLTHIRAGQSCQQVVVRTSQLAYHFYGKHGFRLQEIIPSFWAPGLDLYYMVLNLKEE